MLQGVHSAEALGNYSRDPRIPTSVSVNATLSNSRSYAARTPPPHAAAAESTPRPLDGRGYQSTDTARNTSSQNHSFSSQQQRFMYPSSHSQTRSTQPHDNGLVPQQVLSVEPQRSHFRDHPNVPISRPNEFKSARASTSNPNGHMSATAEPQSDGNIISTHLAPSPINNPSTIEDDLAALDMSFFDDDEFVPQWQRRCVFSKLQHLCVYVLLTLNHTNHCSGQLE